MEKYVIEKLGQKYFEAINLLEDHSISVNYNTSSYYGNQGHLLDLEITITERDGNDDIKTIGTITIQILRHLQFLEYEEAIEQCDDISLDLVEGFSKIVQKNTGKNKSKIHMDTIGRYIYIDKFKMSEDYRGQGIGGAVIHDVIEFLDHGQDLFVVLPFAIEDDDNQETHKRVQNFWKSTGFKKFEKTNYYIIKT